MYAGWAALASATMGCGDLVNHSDRRPGRQVSIAAVYLDRASPTVLFAPCTGDRVYRPMVSDGVSAQWSVIDGDPPNPVTTIRLFVLPAGWSKDTTDERELHAIAGGRGYYVFVDVFSRGTRHFNDHAVNVPLTLSDLKSLGPNDVLAVPTPNAQPEAMTRKQFRAAAAATCHSQAR